MFLYMLHLRRHRMRGGFTAAAVGSDPTCDLTAADVRLCSTEICDLQKKNLPSHINSPPCFIRSWLDEVDLTQR